MTGGGQMLADQPGRGPVVETHRVERQIHTPVDHHPPAVALIGAQLLDQPDVPRGPLHPGRRQHQRPRPERAQRPHGLELPLRNAPGLRHTDERPDRPGLALHRRDDHPDRRRGQIVRHQAHRVGPAAHRPRRQVRRVIQLGGRGEDLALVLRGDLPRAAAQHPGGGGERDPGRAGDVVEGHGRPGRMRHPYPSPLLSS